jgi:hypothetical protein
MKLNHENPSHRKSHTWAPLNLTKRFMASTSKKQQFANTEEEGEIKILNLIPKKNPGPNSLPCAEEY